MEQLRELGMVPYGEEEAQRRPHRSLQPLKGNCREVGVSLCSQVTAIRREVMVLSCIRGHSVWTLETISPPK